MAEKGYCVKCKKSKEMKDEQKVTMKNGRLAVKGKCPDCGTGMYRILERNKVFKIILSYCLKYS